MTLIKKQNYFNDKRHLINKLVNGAGSVINIFINTVDNDNYNFEISNGLEIDCYGQEIIVPPHLPPDEKRYPISKSEINELKKYEKDSNSYGRFGVFLKRFNCLISPTTTVLDNCAHDETCCYNRIAESFEVEFKKFEYPLKKLVFDNLVYDLSDKVKLELWAVYILPTESITVTITSANNNDSKEITLVKNKETNIFQAENEIELETALTKNTTSEYNQLVVSIVDGYNKITATYTKDTSDIVTTYATVLSR